MEQSLRNTTILDYIYSNFRKNDVEDEMPKWKFHLKTINIVYFHLTATTEQILAISNAA